MKPREKKDVVRGEERVDLAFASLRSEDGRSVQIVLAYTDRRILGGVELTPELTVEQALRMISLAGLIDPSVLVKYGITAAKAQQEAHRADPPLEPRQSAPANERQRNQ